MNSQTLDHIRATIRDVPDFPKPGILFYDITTLLQDREGFQMAIDEMARPYLGAGIDVVVGIESRGFIFGSAVADRLKSGFAPVRKPGKLPSTTRSASYALEYGAEKARLIDCRDQLVAEGIAAARRSLPLLYVDAVPVRVDDSGDVVAVGLLLRVTPEVITTSWSMPSAVNCSSRVPDIRRSSSTVPCAMIRPRWTMLIRSHICSATSSVWVLIRIATPRSVIRLNTALMSCAPLGSRPTIGSSTSTARGRCMKAALMTRRCFMPCEKLSIS